MNLNLILNLIKLINKWKYFNKLFSQEISENVSKASGKTVNIKETIEIKLKFNLLTKYY